MQHRMQEHLASPADMSQVDDGYPSDRVMLTSTIKIITYLSDTLMVKNQPCPDLQTPPGVVNRRKLDDKTYQFPVPEGLRWHCWGSVCGMPACSACLRACC